jgi:hypothetical protein
MNVVSVSIKIDLTNDKNGQFNGLAPRFCGLLRHAFIKAHDGDPGLCSGPDGVSAFTVIAFHSGLRSLRFQWHRFNNIQLLVTMAIQGL